MDNLQVDRIFAMLADIDKRLMGRLDHMSDNLSVLKSDVAALTAWRDSWTAMWAAEQARSSTFEQRLRTLEARGPEIEIISRRLEELIRKMDSVGDKPTQEALTERLDTLEKMATKATAIWAAVVFLSGIGLQFLFHFVWRVG